eukprot:TRINITY_DN5130_c0_g1_i1.p1 TRINITY_DN5130_c0_g1~~TRINITY_DN5130_c0_g1_i1.p1  ORF type:complete len:119 (-),score=20.33 TRINITY_DN5130_c0_g1_i1:73-429(-)
MEDLQGMKGHFLGYNFEKDKDDLIVKKVLDEIASFHAFNWNKSPVQNPPTIYEMMFCKMGIRLCDFFTIHSDVKLENGNPYPTHPRCSKRKIGGKILSSWDKFTKPQLFDPFRRCPIF